MRKIVLLIIICYSQTLNGQDLQVNVEVGYGSYQLYDLKDLQSELKNFYAPLQIEEVEVFPNYINYSASLEYMINPTYYVGVNGAFFSTGGRNHIKDYSGEYKLDMPINCIRIGAQSRNIFQVSGKVSGYLMLRVGVVFSSLSIDEKLTAYGSSVSESYSFKSLSYFGEPSIGVNYSLLKNISINLGVGYQLDIQGKFHKPGNNKIELMNTSGGNVYANWSGIRTYLGLMYQFLN